MRRKIFKVSYALRLQRKYTVTSSLSSLGMLLKRVTSGEGFERAGDRIA